MDSFPWPNNAGEFADSLPSDRWMILVRERQIFVPRPDVIARTISTSGVS